ncbi:MAG: Crp/Fnr family transcriptional regulator [Chitinophaga sp.]|uniref:Crp/Fnr family transcriptional regulator n=1 Tax=Chitinophaga sp. TaxID=1869181 RepID=UPI0025C488D5|nr:Crp/Fnr family transcriptional regulator [Chitinophaga sp.]MBV8253054.1 Crp/Fnr family transcriptional regulator [Chitinophaga sp.]
MSKHADILAMFSLYYPLSAATSNELEKLFDYRSNKKNEIILPVGNIPHYYYFIQKGLWEYYYLADNGDKVIKRFFQENSFVASTAALIQEAPSIFGISCLEAGTYIRIPAKPFRALMMTNIELMKFHISYLEKNWIVDKEPMEISLKYETAEERYRQFKAEHPGLLQRLKQHHIAAYLGITPTQLSRIRKH